ncbi:monooxygenase [Paenibacillus sp. MER 180]|uniref:monooxygenase n=1 Tax=Paenibacillus sp. MER 180 TaxID=2939570 RepID=UPI00203B0F9A|nr:monooxygenase [Paenibacillus sp. MER 180]MCM3293921.1 monooxygenase [Paenibacillus sp. MER 180]
MKYEVIIVGAGPVGLMLASELARFGVNACILERQTEPGIFSKATNLHPRSLEILEMRGLLGSIIKEGYTMPTGHFSSLPTRLDFTVLDTRSNHVLFIPQTVTERVLEEEVRSFDVPFHRGVDVVSVQQDEELVEVVAVGSQGVITFQAEYVIGADGAGSIVRKQSHIPFDGSDSTMTGALGDVTLGQPPVGNALIEFNQHGNAMIIPLPEAKYRIVVADPVCSKYPKEMPVTLEELRSSMQRICGTDFGMSDPVWMSRFGNATRIARQYRSGRVFLAGDAAHIHFPSGGQGLNVGMQEAMNLGWKLAGEIQGWAPDWLLDSYHQERHQVADSVLRNTEVQTKLIDFTPAGLELRKTIAHLLTFPEANRYLAERISALDVLYEQDPEMPTHVLNGTRLPNLDLYLANGEFTSLYSLLHTGCYVCLLLEDKLPDSVEVPTSAPLRIIQATIAARRAGWEDVYAVLIRPDGHVAWALRKYSDARSELPALLQYGIQRWCSR